VYRTLELMLEEGLVGEVRDSHGQARYEHTFDRPAHAHMICDRCQRLIECGDLGVEARIDEVCKARRFSKRGYRLVVFGTCNRCG